MSRREVRESDSKRHRSHFDRELSPKRSRRDGKPATERPSGNVHSGIGDPSDRDKKNSQRLRDALPLEAPATVDAKVDGMRKSKDSERGTSEKHDGTKSSANPTDANLSRSSYFQHDERGRRHGRGAASEREWQRDLKDQRSEKAIEKIETRNSDRKDERKNQDRRDDNNNHSWRHDGFYEMERDRQLAARKRPPFRERKPDVGQENTEKPRAQPDPESVRSIRPRKGTEREDERERYKPRGNFMERDRYNGEGNYRGRERFNGSRRNQASEWGGDKWKHDLYEEANRSPTPKNDEDEHIARVEALLAS